MSIPGTLEPTHTVCHELAAKMLNLKINFNQSGNIILEAGDETVVFSPGKSDAEILEEIALMWEQIKHCMDEILNADLYSFIQKNKKGFN